MMMSGLLPRCLLGPWVVSHSACCCSVSFGRCDRCDLLVDLEGFHLMGVARTPDALVFDVESCNQLVGCPGCGVTCSRSRACGGDRRALGPGFRCGSGGTIRRWMCRERTCRIVTFIEQNHSVCALRARVGVRVIRWAMRQLRFEGATILGLARQLATTWNTVWSPLKPCLQAASEPRPPSQACGYPESMRGVWHHHDRRRQDPRAHRHRGPLAGRIVPRPA